jgi:hypothetical protein
VRRDGVPDTDPIWPLTKALWDAFPALKKARIKVYGWLNLGGDARHLQGLEYTGVLSDCSQQTRNGSGRAPGSARPGLRPNGPHRLGLLIHYSLWHRLPLDYVSGVVQRTVTEQQRAIRSRSGRGLRTGLLSPCGAGNDAEDRALNFAPGQ